MSIPGTAANLGDRARELEGAKLLTVTMPDRQTDQCTRMDRAAAVAAAAAGAAAGGTEHILLLPSARQAVV